MGNNCPYCGKNIKSHKFNTKLFRELTPREMKSSIAAATRWLKAMKAIYTTRRTVSL